jgi:hypothetical protein
MLQIIFISPLYCIYDLVSLIYFFSAVHRHGLQQSLILLYIINLFAFIMSKYPKHFVGIWNKY